MIAVYHHLQLDYRCCRLQEQDSTVVAAVSERLPQRTMLIRTESSATIFSTRFSLCPVLSKEQAEQIDRSILAALRFRLFYDKVKDGWWISLGLDTSGQHTSMIRHIHDPSHDRFRAGQNFPSKPSA